MILETDRLRLRVPDAADVDALAAILRDPHVAQYLGPRVETRRHVLAHVRTVRARHDADGFGLLTIVRKRDDRVIGRSGFLVWDGRTWSTTTLRDAGMHGVVEIGWTLARDCWGNGYATEAGAACRDHGLRVLTRDRIIAVIQHGNARSVRVAQKLGMRYDRDIRTAKGFDAQLYCVHVT